MSNLTPHQLQLLTEQHTLANTHLHIFTQHTDEALQQRFASLTPLEQKTWLHEQYRTYNELTLTLLRAYVASIRQGWEYSSDTPDPLDADNHRDFLTQLRSIPDTLADNHWYHRPPIITAQQQANEVRKQQRLEAERTLIVNGTPYTVIKKTAVYYSGWECDDTAWVVNTPTGPQLVMSDHGGLYFAAPEELDSKIKEYQTAISSTQDLLTILRPPSPPSGVEHFPV